VSISKRLRGAGYKGPHPLADWKTAAERAAEDVAKRSSRSSREKGGEGRPRQASWFDEDENENGG